MSKDNKLFPLAAILLVFWFTIKYLIMLTR